MKKVLIAISSLSLLILTGCNKGITINTIQTGEVQTGIEESILTSGGIDTGIIDTGITTTETIQTGTIEQSPAIIPQTTGENKALLEAKIKNMIERRKEEIKKEPTTPAQEDKSGKLNEKDIQLLQNILDEIATGTKK